MDALKCQIPALTHSPQNKFCSFYDKYAFRCLNVPHKIDTPSVSASQLYILRENYTPNQQKRSIKLCMDICCLQVLNSLNQNTRHLLAPNKVKMYTGESNLVSIGKRSRAGVG